MKKEAYFILVLIISCNFQGCREEIIPDPLNISSVVTDVTEYGGRDGSIDITVSGGTPPYSFSWSNNKQTEDIEGLSAGSYAVSVSDQDNQVLSDTFQVAQPAADELALTITGQDASVYGGEDGEAHAYVTGGVIPYSYSWSNGLTDKDITGLVAGTYSLTVTDAEEEQVTGSILIAQPSIDAVIVRYELTEPSETGAEDGAIDISVTGGYPPYSFLWSDGPETEDRTGLGAGTYSLTVSDEQEQIASETIVVTDVVTDVDGNSYAQIRIGQQIWMKENLRVTRTPARETFISYAYNDDENNASSYGRLYTWDVAMNNVNISGSQGICPCGWHIPTDNEFKVLEIYLGMTSEEADMENTWRGAGVGTAMKEGGWSGYEARLCGRRSTSGSYSLINQFEYVWTSDEYGDNAWRRCLDLNSDLSGRWNTFPKSYAFSVRCIKDE